MFETNFKSKNMTPNNSQASIVITAGTQEELQKLVQDMVNQGWHSDGNVVHNPDGTYSVQMFRNSDSENSGLY